MKLGILNEWEVSTFNKTWIYMNMYKGFSDNVYTNDRVNDIINCKSLLIYKK